ncbi:futalosine hydrolase [Streptomyces montanisoli]|uniref:Futalosine hydrolase n=1 Tax=Streptomyces montanisoli TaxID=2798581 RepID=A0A940S0M7_9ACTN|nr:futalosine hydrolase [Streptomyces montanisoli]MBP0461453.1 futalosine hydrolase [Streptomyces montanisoli]
MPRVLVVTAVAVEAEAVAAGAAGASVANGGTRVDVLAGGAGPAAVAAATATALARASAAGDPYTLVVSAGIGGGFAPRAPLGSVVVADEIIAADLGADTPDGYLAVEELGFGRSTHRPPAALAAAMARSLAASPDFPSLLAPVLTVSTVTGTARRTVELAARHPRAAAEGMEGFGVAEAAAVHRLPCAEVRAISNTVGPRDRAAWRIGPALAALKGAFSLLNPVFEETFDDRRP